MDKDIHRDQQHNLKSLTDAGYKPAKLNYGSQHPDSIIESATLASITPADIIYKLSLPQKVIDDVQLSNAQLENVVYACQAHRNFLPNGERVGFLIGDGAGVGKGRSLSGIIFEIFLNGRKRSVWISCSSDLKHDATRDVKDIGAGHIEVHDMKKVSNV